MLKIALGIVALGAIVFVHEFGHFLMAKICGVEVKAFSLGMGPVVAHAAFKGTDYRISLVPLGGYCSMKGEDAFSDAVEQNLREVPKEPHSFYGVHPLKRAAIAFAGPAANLLFAFLALFATDLVGFDYWTATNKIVLASDIFASSRSAAADAGLETGDEIVEIDGVRTDNFSEIYNAVAVRPEKNVLVKVMRGGEILQFMVRPELDKSSGAGKIGVYSWQDAVVEAVLAGGAADLAGIRAGDEIVEADGKKIRAAVEFSFAVAENGRHNVTLRRGGTLVDVELDVDGGTKSAGLGIAFPAVKVREGGRGIFAAAKKGFFGTLDIFEKSVKSIAVLFKGVDLGSAISGPIRITSMLGDVAQTGFSAGLKQGAVSLLNFLAVISVSLCMMNLLPIPVLDGAIVLFSLVEAAAGRQINPKLRMRLQIFGAAALLAIVAFATFNDIQSLVPTR